MWQKGFCIGATGNACRLRHYYNEMDGAMMQVMISCLIFGTHPFIIDYRLPDRLRGQLLNPVIRITTAPTGSRSSRRCPSRGRRK